MQLDKVHICTKCSWAVKHYDFVSDSIVTTRCMHPLIFVKISVEDLFSCSKFKQTNEETIKALLTRKDVDVDVDVEWFKV